jgi:hypothetical protein
MSKLNFDKLEIKLFAIAECWEDFLRPDAQGREDLFEFEL